MKYIAVVYIGLIKFIFYDGEKNFHYDRLLAHRDKYQKYLEVVVFSTRETLEADCKNNNIEIASSDTVSCKPKRDINNLSTEAIEKLPWKEAFERYHQLQDPLCYASTREERERLEKEKKGLTLYYEALGIERIRELKYDITEIKKEHVKLQNRPMEIKIVNLLQERITLGKAYPVAEINKFIDEICKEYKLSPKIFTSQLDNYFIVSRKSPKVDGKTQRQITFIARKSLDF